MTRLTQQVRNQVFDKKSRKRVESMSQTRTNLSKTRLQTWSKTRFELPRISLMECGLRKSSTRFAACWNNGMWPLQPNCRVSTLLCGLPLGGHITLYDMFTSYVHLLPGGVNSKTENHTQFKLRRKITDVRSNWQTGRARARRMSYQHGLYFPARFPRPAAIAGDIACVCC